MNDDATLAYLVALYGEKPEGLLWIGGQMDGWKGRAFADPIEAATYAHELDARGGIGVYHRLTTLAEMPERRGTDEDTGWVYAIGSDLDVGGPGHKPSKSGMPHPPDEQTLWTLLDKAGMPSPTFWTASGGGFYPIWRLTEPLDVRTEEARQGAAAFLKMTHARIKSVFTAAGYALDGVFDLSRVYRLPGTWNRKPEMPAPVLAEVREQRSETFSVAQLSHNPPAASADAAPVVQSSQLFGGEQTGPTPWPREQAYAELNRQFEVVRNASNSINSTVGGAARRAGHFVPAILDHDTMVATLLIALEEGGHHSDEWNAENGRDWTGFSLIDTAVSRGESDPFVVLAPAETSASPEAVEDSWAPVDVTAVLNGEHERVVPALGRRSDGIRILYPGKEHAIASEPECGKTWWVMLQVKSVLEEGGKVVYIDFEDDEGTIVGRLMSLGISHDLLGPSCFRYVRPDHRPPDGVVTRLCTFGEESAQLVILDGMTEGLGLMGLSALDQEAIVDWRKTFVKPAMRLNSATLTTDHVVKAADNRGRYAIGAQHKLAGLNGVMFTMNAFKPFGQGLDGVSKVYITKDRNGGLRAMGKQEEGRTEIGELHGVCSDGRNEWSFRPPVDREARLASEADRYPGLDGKFRRFVAPVLQYVAQHPEMSTKVIKENVMGRGTDVGMALQWLVDKKAITTSVGAGGGRLHSVDAFVAASTDVEKSVLDSIARYGHFLPEE